MTETLLYLIVGLLVIAVILLVALLMRKQGNEASPRPRCCRSFQISNIPGKPRL